MHAASKSRSRDRSFSSFQCRRFVVGAFILAVGLTLLGCSKSRTFHLVQAPDADLGFAVLYAGDAVAEIGPVSPGPELSAGTYRLESKQGDLDPRVFLIQLPSLQATATAVCSGVDGRIAKVACRERVADCARDPTSCLVVHRAGETCGDRISLDGLPLVVLAPSPRGDLLPVQDPAPSLARLQLCGPSLARACPLRVPGFVVTEASRFRCTAPAVQSDCAVAIDMRDCGLGVVTGILDARAALTGTVAASGCVVDAPAPGSEPTSSFQITCGQRHFVASYMETLFGTPGCPRRVPAAFEEIRAPQPGVGDPANHAAITGLKSIAFEGWSARYLILGTGYDDCAMDACYHLGPGCVQNCGRDCTEFVDTADCQNRNLWAACATEGTAASECVARCTKFCASQSSSMCASQARGHSLVVTSTAVPERDVARISVSGSGGVSSHAGLVVLVDASGPLVLAADPRAAHGYRPRGADSLDRTLTIPMTRGSTLAGIVPRADDPAAALAFGGAPGPVPAGALWAIRPSAASPVSLIARVPELPLVDAVAIAGANGDQIVAASLSAPGTALAVRSLSGQPEPPLQLEGRATALGALPGGAVLVGVDREAGGAVLQVFPPQGSGFASPLEFALLGGLHLSALVADPATCSSQSAACQVFLGLEQDASLADVQPALVGMFEYHPSAPQSSRILPSYIKTASGELTTLEYDPHADQLVAAASTQGRITQIMLIR